MLVKSCLNGCFTIFLSLLLFHFIHFRLKFGDPFVWIVIRFLWLLRFFGFFGFLRFFWLLWFLRFVSPPGSFSLTFFCHIRYLVCYFFDFRFISRIILNAATHFFGYRSKVLL